MAGLLTNFRNTVILALILAALMIVAFGFVAPRGFDREFARAVLNWAMAVSGMLWLGLLYYFNFVQIRVMSQIPIEQKQVINLYVSPVALFWVRWSSLAAVVFGLCAQVAHSGTYLAELLSFGAFRGYPAGDPGYTMLGLGAWLGLLMCLNTWAVIWPNQKRALNIGMGAVELDDDMRTRAARVAMLATRTNLLLSVPMLVALAMQPLYG